MEERPGNLRPGMLVLAALFAAWSAYTYVASIGQPERSWLGVVILALASVFCALRARRKV